MEMESKMLKEKEKKEGIMALKNEKDQERKKMREDIQKRAKEMRSKQSQEVGVELVGIPDFMQLGQTKSDP